MVKNTENKPEAKTAGEQSPDPDKAAKMPSRRRAFIAALVVITVVILAWRHYIEPMLMADFRPSDGAQVETVGVPNIGGPFTLVDQDGKTVSEADFKGQYMLIYFGYTYCPDVCPTSLSIMADAIDSLGEDGKKITPVFVTVDPERDDAAALKMYVEHFHPRLVGLTGSLEQVVAAAKAFKAYFARVGDGYNDGEYAMDHSSITYLMGPDNQFITHFGHGVEAGEMAKKLADIL